MCDYRKLNQITKFDAYTILDLAKGYWQVPVSPEDLEDREKMVFVSPKGLSQFVTMPFGLSGAPATFQ